jgi:hypothetical protein
MMWRSGGSEPAKLLGPPVDNPEIDVGKPDQPVAGFGFGKTDGLADQRLAEKDRLAAPADLAVASHIAHGVIGIVPGRLNLIRIGPRRGPIAARRRHLAERFMWPIVVEVVAERSKRTCCSAAVAAGGREVSALRVACMRS